MQKSWTMRKNVLRSISQSTVSSEIVGKPNDVRRVNSVPQIFVDGDRIGGYDDLMKYAETLFKKRGGGSLLKFSETYKPFYYPWAVEITTRHEKVHWIEDELDLSEDVSDWKSGKVTVAEKDYITNILRLFTQNGCCSWTELL